MTGRSIIEIKEKDGNVEFIGGNMNMVRFLEANLKYPNELLSIGKEGSVMFHFIVRKDGTMDKIEFQKSDERLFNQEAVRVFSLIKKLTPARQHGRIVEQECTFPVNFRIR